MPLETKVVGGECTAIFKNTTIDGAIETQMLYLKAALKAGVYRFDEKIVVDNSELRLDVGVAAFFDFSTGKCGFSHSLPGVIVRLFCDASRRKRPKIHWWVAYKGDALPNPTYPYPCKKPW